MISTRLQLCAELHRGAVEAIFLELEREASAPYNRFVYAQEDVIRRAQRALLEAGSGEFVPPHGRIVLLDGDPVGMLAALGCEELKAARIAAALALTRSGLLDDEGIKRRVRLAAHALMHSPEGDYYLSRIALTRAWRGRVQKGRTLGMTLLEAVEQEADAAGAERLVAEVDAGQTRLLAFYERCGFREVGEGQVTDAESGRELRYAHLAKRIG